MITDFGQRSFVTWTTGLIERVQKAEKEIQMRPYRGLTKEGKRVYGWYKYHPYYEIHLINTFEESEQLDGGGYWKEFEVVPETVGQFVTKDKNGTEIYEGDILQLIFETLELRGVVQQTESGEWELYKDEENHLGVHHNMSRVTVIGNIHENPELIEEQENDS